MKMADSDNAGRMPVLFVGHGSPMNMVQENPYTRSLAALGRDLPRPAAIMVISAHWLTWGIFVTCAGRSRMIYDFYGFPDELYQVTYPCPGATSGSSITVRTRRLLSGPQRPTPGWDPVLLRATTMP